jgi:hypothetical protein
VHKQLRHHKTNPLLATIEHKTPEPACNQIMQCLKLLPGSHLLCLAPLKINT